MTNLNIPNMSEALLVKLQQRAVTHGHSVEDELIFILKQYLKDDLVSQQYVQTRSMAQMLSSDDDLDIEFEKANIQLKDVNFD